MGKRLMITVEQNGERLKETEADIDGSVRARASKYRRGEMKPIRGYAACNMASTVTVRRRNWSLRQSAGTCWWWRERRRRKLRSSSWAWQNRAADLGHLKPRMGR